MGNNIVRFVSCTQEEYDKLNNKDENIFYRVEKYSKNDEQEVDEKVGDLYDD